MFEIIGKALAGVLGGTRENGESQFLSAIENIFKGKEAKKQEFLKEMERLHQERLDLEMKDLQDARAMQIEALRQDDIFSKRFLYYLTGSMLLLTVLATFLPLFVHIPVENKDLVARGTDFLYIISGSRIIAFFFGNKNSGNGK